MARFVRTVYLIAAQIIDKCSTGGPYAEVSATPLALCCPQSIQYIWIDREQERPREVAQYPAQLP